MWHGAGCAFFHVRDRDFLLVKTVVPGRKPSAHDIQPQIPIWLLTNQSLIGGLLCLTINAVPK
jgi:hypothetical protein